MSPHDSEIPSFHLSCSARHRRCGHRFPHLPRRRADARPKHFRGTNPAGQDSISTTNATLVAGNGTTGSVGPGFTGNVTLGIGALDTLTETINAGGNATLTARETGQGVINILGNPTGAGVGGTFSATKALGVSFVPNQAYSFTLTTTTNAALNALSGANVTFTTVDNGTTTNVFNASGGTGLLGLVQVINLFGTGNTATFNFTAPANVDTTVPITVTISGGLSATALGSSFSFTNGTLNAVPEPGTIGAMGVGIVALATLRFRRRLARN